jgi:hypothetical protein
MNWAQLPKIDPRAKNCVRYNPRSRRYQLVDGGKVTATISRLGMTIPATRAAFTAKVKAQARLRQMDALVERLYPDEDTDCEARP